MLGATTLHPACFLCLLLGRYPPLDGTLGSNFLQLNFCIICILAHTTQLIAGPPRITHHFNTAGGPVSGQPFFVTLGMEHQQEAQVLGVGHLFSLAF